MRVTVMGLVLVLVGAVGRVQAQDSGTSPRRVSGQRPNVLAWQPALRAHLALEVRHRMRLQGQPAQSQRVRHGSRTKAVVIGAAIGGGVGALGGVAYCASDCGGWPGKAPTLFGLMGAGLGAGTGLLVALFVDHVP